MRRPVVTGQFKRDLRRMRKRGKDRAKIRAIMEAILSGDPPPERMQDHTLKGEWRGRRECRVEPDWLLIYLLRGDDEMVFERTGRHVDVSE